MPGPFNPAAGYCSSSSPPICNQPNPEECCEHFGGIDHFFCLAFCVFCCMTCVVQTVEPCADQEEPEPAIPRDYANFSVINGEIGFTVSEYGRFLPIVFGSDKLTGNVFWYSGFTKKQFKKSGTIYEYETVSFALGLCEGVVDAILRMWLGDALIFDRRAEVDENGIIQPGSDGFVLGATVDLVSADSPLKDLTDSARLTRITVFNGSETQLPEGIIVDKEGEGLTPAYRGTAYILFENMVVTQTIPNISVEVLANTNPIYPRLYANLPVPQEYFDTPANGPVIYDAGYDQLIVGAIDDSGSGTVANGAGYTAFDGNKLEHLYSREMVVTEGVDGDGRPSQLFVLQNGNWLVIYSKIGEGGTLFTYNPFVGKRLSTLPGTGNILSNDFPDGFGYLEPASTLFVYPVKGPPVDVFCGVHPSGHVGFAIIDDSGRIEMTSSTNDVFPAGGGSACPLIVLPAQAADTPNFADGATSVGAHVYFFTHGTITGDTGGAYVTRATVSGDGSVYAPVFTSIGYIDFNEFGGTAFIHRVKKVMLDDSDNCFILLVSSTRGDWIAKWSPFTATFVWKSPATLYNQQVQSAPNALLWGPSYGYIGDNQHIYVVDLATGVIEDRGTLTNQSLPDANGIQQFYNGYENTIVYLASEGAEQIIKVYLDRLARANVPVADIVTTLLDRVGVGVTERDTDDLQALSLVGYTINERKSLRTVYSELAQVFRFDIIESNGRVVYKTRGGAPVASIPTGDFADFESEGWLKQHRENDFTRVRKINLTYRDIDREYESNVQSVFLPKYDNTRFEEDAAIDVSVPVVLEADDAKRLAEILLYSKVVYQTTYESVIAPEHLVLDPGDVITIPSDDGTQTVRLRDVSIGNDRQVKISASKEDPDIYNDQLALFGVVGRYVSSTLSSIDARVDPFIFEMPFRSESEAALTSSTYIMFFTLLNQRSVVPPSGLITINVGGSDPVTLNPPTRFPTWGRVVTPLAQRTSLFTTDTQSELRIKLFSATGLTLESAASFDAMLNNSQVNLAYVGGELIQFQTVVDEGGGEYTLTNIHRGKFGTEVKAFSHIAGEEFILLGSSLGVLDTEAIIPFSVPFGDSPFKMYQSFINTNNPFQSRPMKFATALNLRPWAVSSFYGSYVGNDLSLTWQRRTRFDGEWEDDGTDAVPLNELTETYEAYLYTDAAAFNFSDDATYLRKLTLSADEYTYTAAQQTEDGFDRTSEDLYVLVIQKGSWSGNDAGASMRFKVEYKR